MASFFDILAQDSTDAKGRFNPAKLIRGFTKQGRNEIDGQQKIAALGRQNQIGGLQRTQQAVDWMGSKPDPMGAQPTSPEQADVLSRMLSAMQQQAGVTGAQGANKAQAFQTERGQALLPGELQAQSIGNQSATEGLVTQKAVQPDVVRSAGYNADILGAQASTAGPTADAQLAMLQRSAKQQPMTPEQNMLAGLYPSMQFGDPRMLAYAQQRLGMPGQPRQDGPSPESALQDAVNNVKGRTQAPYSASPQAPAQPPTAPSAPNQPGNPYSGRGGIMPQTRRPLSAPQADSSSIQGPAPQTQSVLDLNPSQIQQLLQYLQTRGRGMDSRPNWQTR